MGWIIVIIRILAMFVVIFGGLLILLLLRIFEKPLFGHNRPITPFLNQAVCKISLRIMGINQHIFGRAMTNNGAVVANHSSWLDIFTLNATQQVYFVSKSEVAAWPGIGWLARGAGTVFIKRDRQQAKLQRDMLSSRLQMGHKLLFFPEGTSTDGRQVLPFKSTLFAALFNEKLRSKIIEAIKINLSYKHIPSQIYAVSEIPRTRSGKIVEILIKKLINGENIENEESLANPESLKEFELVYKNLKNNYAK